MTKCPETGRWFQKIFMILKFLWWFLNLCVFKNHFIYTFEITKIQDILYRQGTSERYAPLGLSFPPLPRRAPFSRSRGRLRRSEGPCRPAMFGWWIISVTDHVNMALTKTKKCRMILRQLTMSLDRQNRAYKTCQKRNSEVVYVIGRKPLVFDPLGNLNSALRLNYQKVILL